MDKTEPKHYKNEIEPIDVIENYDLNFNLGNVIKYVLRAGKKDGEAYSDDLKKALWYLEREIKKDGADVAESLPKNKPSYFILDYSGEQNDCGLKSGDMFISPSVDLIALNSKPTRLLKDRISAHHYEASQQYTGNYYEDLLEYAGRICYDSSGKPKSRPTKEYLLNLYDSKHHSVFGHAVLSFEVTTKLAKLWFDYFQAIPGWWVDLADSEVYRKLTVNLRFILSEEVREFLFHLDGDLVMLFNTFERMFCEQYPILYDNRTDFDYDKAKFHEFEPAKINWYTFEIICSRSCSHEWIRHSYQSAISQRSTRYVDESDFNFVLHPEFDGDISIVSNLVKDSKAAYAELMKSDLPLKTKRAVAARILPHGMATKIVYTVSEKELGYIFEQRISDHADAEIREIATQCRDLVLRHKDGDL